MSKEYRKHGTLADRLRDWRLDDVTKLTLEVLVGAKSTASYFELWNQFPDTAQQNKLKKIVTDMIAVNMLKSNRGIPERPPTDDDDINLYLSHAGDRFVRSLLMIKDPNGGIPP